jgi:hypothetical protein
MTREDLERQYASLSTNELLEIVDRKFDYTELAVTIALEEIHRRSVTEADIREYKEEQISKAVTFIKRNIEDDLSLLQKILFFFAWLPLLNFPFKQNFRDGNYILKLKQANYYSFLGFAFMFLVGIASGWYSFSNLTAFTIWFLSFLPAYGFDESFNRKRQIHRLKMMFGSQEEEERP